MNQNELPDARIDRLLSDGTPSGIPIVDDLADTIPTATTAFQHDLEDRLIAHLQSRTLQGDEQLTHSTALTNSLPLAKRLIVLPLTLAAALIAVVLVGSILIVGGKPPAFDTAMLQVATATSTLMRSPTVTPESVAIILPPDRLAVTVPLPSITSDGDTLVLHEGDHLDLSATFQFTNAADGSFQFISATPDDVSLNLSDAAPTGNCAEETPCPITQSVIHDAIVVHVGDFDSQSADTPPDIATLAVSPDEAQLLVWLIEAQIPLTAQLSNSSTPPPDNFVPVVIAAQSLPWSAQLQADDLLLVYWPSEIAPADALHDLAAVNGKYLTNPVAQWQPLTSADVVDTSPFQGFIPAGMVAHEMPREWIANEVSNLQAGDHVDIQAAFLFANTNIDWELANTLVPADGWVEVKTLLTDVQVYKMGRVRSIGTDEEAITLLLSPEDALMLTWLYAATKPLAFTLTPSDQDDIPSQVLPDGRVSMDVPKENLVNAEGRADFTEGDQGYLEVKVDFKGFEPSDPSTYALSGSGQASIIISQNAEVIATPDDSTVTLAVPSEDAPMLQWAVNADFLLNLGHTPQ